MADAQEDAYLAAEPTATASIRRWAQAAEIVGGLYLVSRAAFTLDGAAWTTSLLLLVAEGLGLVVFSLRVRSAWHAPADVLDMPDAPTPSAIAVIDADGATPEHVRTSLVSCARLRGLERVVVSDPEGRSAVRSVAERFSARIDHAPATSVVANSSAAWVLLVRAGDLPLPDALELLATPCSSPDTGVIQLGVEEADPSSFEHDPSGRWSLGPFEQQVVRPSLAASGSIPWYGDVPAMVRPAAIRDAADTSAPTVDLGVYAASIGYRVTMAPRTLARLRGPQSLGESLCRRFEHTAAVRRRAMTRLGDVPVSLRRALWVALVEPLAAVQRVLLVLVAILVLGMGRSPVDAALMPLALVALPAYGLRWHAQSLVGRGRLGRFSVLRSELRSIGVDLAFGSRRMWAVTGGGLRLLGILMAAVAAAVGVGTIALWQDSAQRLPVGVAAVALATTAGFSIVAAEVLLEAIGRRQQRSDHRVRLGLVTCRLDEHEGQLADLSLGGCGVTVVGDRRGLPGLGDGAVVSFRIPDAGGAWRDVRVGGRIAHVATITETEHRIGVAFAEPLAESLDPVIEFLTIDRRLVALGRRVPSA